MQSYLGAVSAYREANGIYTKEVIEPLVGLGDNYQRSKQYRQAIAAYEEARGVSRHDFGLLNPGQMDILDRMTKTYESLNDYKNADKQQRAELELAQRSYKKYAPEMLKAQYKYADWLRQSNRFGEERDEYAQAERIIKEHYGENSLLMVEPLEATGNSFRAQRNPQNQGFVALQKALGILQKDPDAPQLTKAEVLRDIGDWKVAFAVNDRALDNSEYRQAWALLGSVDGGGDLRQQWFSGVTYVLRAPIDRHGLSTAPDALSGHVLVKFDLSRNGRPENVSVIESEPPDMENKAVLEHVKMSRFRPHMANGVVVSGERLALQFNFRYKPDEGAKEKKSRGRKRK